MIKHLYLNSSNQDYLSVLRDDPNFEFVSRYPPTELPKTHQHEFGRYKLKDCHLHILVGTPRHDNCPWCGGHPEMERIFYDDTTLIPQYSVYAMICRSCGSRGKTLKVAPAMESSPEMMQEVESILRASYRNRLPWDHKLTNQYD